MGRGSARAEASATARNNATALAARNAKNGCHWSPNYLLVRLNLIPCPRVRLRRRVWPFPDELKNGDLRTKISELRDKWCQDQ